MKVHVPQGFKFKNTNKHKNQLVLLDKTKSQLPPLLIRYKKTQTVCCSSHSNGFHNMSIIALRRQCKCYFEYFFQMSSNFFVFWQIPTCDHLNETFSAAPSFLLLLFLYICCCRLLLYRFIYNVKVCREMHQWIQSKDWNFKKMDQSRAPQSLCSIMNGIFSIIVNLLALKNHICWDTYYANLELATGYVRS